MVSVSESWNSTHSSTKLRSLIATGEVPRCGDGGPLTVLHPRDQKESIERIQFNTFAVQRCIDLFVEVLGRSCWNQSVCLAVVVEKFPSSRSKGTYVEIICSGIAWLKPVCELYNII